jgi:hypothetical protein
MASLVPAIHAMVRFIMERRTSAIGFYCKSEAVSRGYSRQARA